MKIAAASVIAALLTFGGVIMFRLWRESGTLTQNLSAAEAKMQKAQAVDSDLSAQLDYLSHPENVAKELRARFNLHLPGEHSIIIVSPAGSSTVSSTMP